MNCIEAQFLCEKSSLTCIRYKLLSKLFVFTDLCHQRFGSQCLWEYQACFPSNRNEDLFVRHLACISLAPMVLMKLSGEWRGMWRVSYCWLHSYQNSIECRMQIAALVAQIAQLKQESESLHHQRSLTKQDVTDINKTLEVLMDTNVAFTAKERHALELSKQLQVAELDLFQGQP